MSRTTIKSSNISVRINDYVETNTLDEILKDVTNKIEDIQDDIADIYLLTDIPKLKDVYSMSYEEYMELPGNVRL